MASMPNNGSRATDNIGEIQHGNNRGDTDPYHFVDKTHVLFHDLKYKWLKILLHVMNTTSIYYIVYLLLF